MLKYEKLNKNGGFVLWGDYTALKAVHTLIMDISERSPVLDPEGLTTSLAYDIRKAYEGQRKKEKIEVWDDQITTYGVEQVWPTFITQIALLRTGFSYCPTSKYEQAQMYLLEDLLECAINAIFPKEAQSILQCYDQLVGNSEQTLAPLLGSRVSYFLNATSAQRRKKLGPVLWSLSPIYDAFSDIKTFEDRKDLIHPHEFNNRGWDDIEHMPAEKMKL